MRFYQNNRYKYKYSSYTLYNYGKKAAIYKIILYFCTKAENPVVEDDSRHF